MQNKIGFGDMRVTKLLNMSRAKAKTRSKNRFKTYRKVLQETREKNVFFETMKRHLLMVSELETDIVLTCCDALRYLCFAIFVLCLYSSR